MARPVDSRFLAIVNPAAGGGRCGKLAGAALDRFRAAGVALDVVHTSQPREASRLAREGYVNGYRDFLAVGGDGTSFEILNGLFPLPTPGERPALAFLPLGTGNSFLRDFTRRGWEHTLEALLQGQRRASDVLCLTHAGGVLYFLNLVTLGFAADVASATNRYFKRWGRWAYILGVLTCVIPLERRAFPVRVEGSSELDRRRCLFLVFSNSKFTGGRMMIAPQAQTDDGLIEYVRWGPIGRVGLLRTLPALFDGTHIRHPLASRQPTRRVEFELEGPVNVMIDGESLALHCQNIDVLPAAIDVFV